MKIILASKSGVRKQILDKYDLQSDVQPSNVDEDTVKESLLKEKATPDIISKNLAELKANKVSLKKTDEIVLGAPLPKCATEGVVGSAINCNIPCITSST